MVKLPRSYASFATPDHWAVKWHHHIDQGLEVFYFIGTILSTEHIRIPMLLLNDFMYNDPFTQIQVGAKVLKKRDQVSGLESRGKGQLMPFCTTFKNMP